MKKIIFSVVVLALAVVVLIGAGSGSHQLEISNAYVSGRFFNITSHTDGVVDIVNIKKGDRVKRGDLLFTIAIERDAKIINQRSQELRTILNEKLMSCLNIEVANNLVEVTETNIDFLKDRLERTKKLISASVIADDDLRLLELQLRQEKSVEEKAKLNLISLKAEDNLSLIERPNIQLAMTNLREALYNKYMNEIRAPYDGYIYEVLAYPTIYAKAGVSQIIFIPTERPTIEANILESELQFIKQGMKVIVIPDISDKREKITGFIQSIVPSTAATFSAFPRNNIDSNWIKVSQRIPIVIRLLDETENSLEMPIGTSVRVIIPTRENEIEYIEKSHVNSLTDEYENNSWENDYKSILEKLVASETKRAKLLLAGHCPVPNWM